MATAGHSGGEGRRGGDFASDNPLLNAGVSTSTANGTRGVSSAATRRGTAALLRGRNGTARRGTARPSGISISMAGMAKVRAAAARSTAHRNTVLNNGVPVREMLQNVHKVRRDKAIKEAIVFAAFAVIFVGILYEINSIHRAFSQSDALLDLFLDEEFEGATYKKNFHEVMTMGEMWQWLQGPLYNGAYPDEWYNGRKFNEYETGYVLMYLRLVGGIQLRQERVTNHSCTIRRFTDLCETQPDGSCLPRYDTKDGTCFSEFHPSRQATKPYGPGGPGFTYSDGHSDMDGLFGFGPSYGDGGYIATLPLNRTEAKETLDFLEANLWTDRGTRAVAIDLNLYNTNARQLTVMRVMFEYFPTTLLVTSYKFYTFRISVYSTRLDSVRLVFEVIFVVFWFYFVQKEVRRFVNHAPPRIGYFTELKNVFEIFLLILALVVMIQWLDFVTNPLRTDFDVNADRYVDMFDLAQNYSDGFSLAGFYALMTFLKGFRYLSISKRMNSLWLTLHSALSDIVTFIVGVAVVISGFAWWAQLCFGFVLVDFHNFVASLSTLMRFPLGDFDYSELQRARPAITSIFFGTYMGIVYFVLANMFVAIVTNHFFEVHERLRTSDRWKESTMTWEAAKAQRVTRKCRKWCRSCRRARNARQRSRSISDPNKTHQWVEAHSEEHARKDEESDAFADQGMDLSAQFERLLHLCVRHAMRVHAIDLMDYLERVYLQKGATRMYMGVHELCYLTRRDMCEPGQHAHRKCLAHRTVEAYTRVKIVLMVGQSKLHQPEWSLAADTTESFSCVKINKNGRKQNRVMVVNSTTGELFNFTKSMTLRKKLPLKQLVQLEFSSTNKAKATLVFTSFGLSHADHEQIGNMETLYQLYFTDKPTRNAFVKSLLKAQAVAIEIHGSGRHLSGGKSPTPASPKTPGRVAAAKLAKLRSAAMRRFTAQHPSIATIVEVEDNEERKSGPVRDATNSEMDVTTMLASLQASVDSLRRQVHAIRSSKK